MKKYIKTLLALATAALLGSSAQAAKTYYYYAKLQITISPTQGGKVYAGTQTASNPSYSSNSPYTSENGTTTTKSGSVTYYAYAQANKGYKFSKWTADANGGASISTSSGNNTKAAGAKVNATAASSSGSSNVKTCSITANFDQGKVNVTAGDPVEIALGDTVVLPTFTWAMASGNASDYGLSDSDFSEKYSTDNKTWQTKTDFLKGRFTEAGEYTIYCQVSAEGVQSGSNWQKLTITKPLEFEYESVNFVVSGAEKSFVDGELLLKFTKSGSMTTDGNLSNVRVLVVGGGGSGEAGRNSSSSDYQGNGGGGAEAIYKPSETLSANTYQVEVGAGGPSAVAYTSYSDGNFKSGTAGDPSSFAGVTAKGGSAGTGGAKDSSSPGTGGSALVCNITGPDVTYGKNGKAASDGINKQTKGASGVDGTGEGGQGGRGNDSGAGGCGVVILRVPAQKPVKTLDPVALCTGNKTTVSTACGDPSVIKVTSDKESVATATAAISSGMLAITVQAGATTGTANIKVETASSFYTVAVTVNPKPQVTRASTADSVKAGRPAKSHQLQEAFPQAATWTGDVTSGHANIATATMVNGGQATTQPTMLITPVGEGTTTLTVTSSTDDYDYVWTVTITVLPSGGYVPVPQPEETADSKMHLAYVAGHADQAVIRNYYFGTGGSDGYQFDFKSEVTGSGVSATTTTTGSIADGSTGLTTVTATSATGSGKVAIGRVKYKTGNPPTTGHKNDCNYNTASRVQRVVYVGKTATAYGVFSISINDTAETGTTGSWKTPTVANGLVTAENVAGVSFEHNFVSVTGVSVGWEQVTSEFMTDSPHNPPQPEGVTYTFNFQVRDTPAAEGLIPDQQINFNTKLSTIDLNTQGIVMKDSNGNVVPGEFEWDNPDKTWNARETTVETAVFTATGANAEFYDPVAVDVTIIAGKPKEPSTGTFGDPILVTEGARELTDVPFAWTSWKVVGDDIGVTVEAAASGDPLVKAGPQAGKTVIWIENDDYYRVYEVKVYETKAIDVEGYKNSTKRVKLTSAAEAVWTAHSDDESVATVSMASSEPSANAEAVIVCKGEENDTVTLTVQNDYVVYAVNVTVKGEKQPETGKFNLAAGETAVMSLYYGGDSPAERCFRVNKEEDGISVNRDYAENKNQKTLNLTFTGLQDDGSATVGIQQKQSYDSGNFAAYTGNYITTAVAQPKRIMYLGDTKQLYCLSSEAAAWTVVPADDGVVDVTAPSGAVAEGYAQVSGEKVGTTSFVIGNTAEVAEGFFKGVTYTINYEVRGMPMVNGTLTGDANLTVGDQLSTIGVAGSMKDAKNHEVFGTFAWVDGTQTFDAPGTETVEAIFTPSNTSYDSVKVSVTVTVKIPVDVPTAVTGLTYDGTVQTGVEDGTGYTLAGNTATAAGNHTATATLDNGYCWKDDGSTEPKTIGWSIAKVALTATADNKSTTYGVDAPEFTVSYTGWVKGEEDPTTEPVLESAYVAGSNVGTYDITFATDPEFANYAVTTANGELTVEAAALTSATATPASATYTGQKQNPTVTATAGELDATFVMGDWSGNLTDVGTYTMTVTGNGNFKGTATATFTITKAELPLPGVTFEPMTVTYDSSEYNVTITGTLPEGVSVSYDGNGKTDVGEYPVTATFSLSDELAKNYNIPEAMTTTLKIDPAALTSASAAPQAYTGSQLTPVVTAKAKELDATFDVGAWDGDLVNVGTYAATVTGKGNFTGEVPVTFEITKATPEVGVAPTMTITYGTMLEDGTVSGQMKCNDETVEGSFVFAAPDTMPKVSESGDFPATFKPDDADNYNEVSLTIAVTVSAKELTDAMVTLDAESFIYNGQNQKPEVTVADSEAEITEGDYTITNEGGVSVGEYSVEVEAKGNYTGTVRKTYLIAKATYDMSGVTFTDKTVTYNGEEQTVEIAGDLPEGVSVSYAGNAGTDVGTYDATASFTGDAANYEPIADKAATLTIERAKTAVEPTVAMGLVYNGEAQNGYTAEGENVTLGGEKSATAAGNYEFTATPDSNHAWSDGSTEAKSYDWSIAAKEVGLDWTDTTFTYDGESHKPTATATGLCDGDDVAVTVAGEQIAAGTYTATATALTGEKAANYTLPAEATTQFTILKSSKKPWADGDDPEGAGYEIPADANDWTSLTNATAYSAFDYRGAYDGEAHTIDTSALVTAYEAACVAAPTITYSCDTNADDWAAAPIELTDVGATSVWYKVSVPNYEDVIRVAKIVIDPAQATVTADNAAKTEGEDDPAKFTAKVAGTVAGDEDTIAYTVTRAEGETVGEYEIIPSGDEIQGNYRVTYVNGTFTIKARPTITITIEAGEYVDDVQTNGISVVGKLELPADATEVTLTLEADLDILTVPVFKVVTNGVDGVVTSVTTKVATYAIKDGDTLEFFAEEAEYTDPDVTEKQVKDAIIDAIDPPDPDVPGDAERYQKAVDKVDAVVDTNDEPAPDKVSAKDMATWISDNEIKSVDMAQSDYLVASVKFDTEKPITEENTTIEFVEVEEVSSEAFTFDLSMIVGSQSVDFEEGMEEVVAGCIQTTGDLGTGFDGGTVSASRVTINSDGKVTIEPDSTKSAEFFKIVIPKDPGTK